MLDHSIFSQAALSLDDVRLLEAHAVAEEPMGTHRRAAVVAALSTFLAEQTVTSRIVAAIPEPPLAFRALLADVGETAVGSHS